MAGWIRPSIYVHGCTIRCVCVYGCNRQGIAWLRAKRLDRKEIPLLTLGRRGHAPQRNVAQPRQNAAPAATYTPCNKHQKTAHNLTTQNIYNIHTYAHTPNQSTPYNPTTNLCPKHAQNRLAITTYLLQNTALKTEHTDKNLTLQALWEPQPKGGSVLFSH